jgi:hypothetical protein
METRKVEVVELNERMGYGAAAVLCGSSGVDVAALQARGMGQSPEKPKGYGTTEPTQRWLHPPPPSPDMGKAPPSAEVEKAPPGSRKKNDDEKGHILLRWFAHRMPGVCRM